MLAKYFDALFSIPAPFIFTSLPVTKLTGKSFDQSLAVCSETYLRINSIVIRSYPQMHGYFFTKSCLGECNGSLCNGIGSGNVHTLALAFAFP